MYHNNVEEAMNLKENKKGYKGSLGVRMEKGGDYVIYYYLKKIR